MTLLIVRHAHAGDRATWTAPDHQRPLSGKGERQAKALVDLLGDFRVERILTSSYLRCRQTVAPLADVREVAVETHDALVEGADPSAVFSLARELSHVDAVLCSHGDVIGALVSGLQRLELPPAAPLVWQKASTWVLDATDGVFTGHRYLGPPR